MLAKGSAAEGVGRRGKNAGYQEPRIPTLEDLGVDKNLAKAARLAVASVEDRSAVIAEAPADLCRAWSGRRAKGLGRLRPIARQLHVQHGVDIRQHMRGVAPGVMDQRDNFRREMALVIIWLAVFGELGFV